jgi:hypothetical protein
VRSPSRDLPGRRSRVSSASRLRSMQSSGCDQAKVRPRRNGSVFPAAQGCTISAVSAAGARHWRMPPLPFARDGGTSPTARLGAAAPGRRDPASKLGDEPLVALAAAAISPQDETGPDVDEESLLLPLELADWLGAMISVCRAGAAADASPDGLVSRSYRPAGQSSETSTSTTRTTAGFWTLALRWHVFGLN